MTSYPSLAVSRRRLARAAPVAFLAAAALLGSAVAEPPESAVSLWEGDIGSLIPPGDGAPGTRPRDEIRDELVALLDYCEKRIAELEYRLFELEKARAAPYREVEYRVVNGRILMRGRFGKHELRVPRR